MNYATTTSNGAARDEALKRRNGAVRDGLGPRPTPQAETKKPTEPKPAASDKN